MTNIQFQRSSQVIDITQWERDQEFPIYSEGAQSKTLLCSPADKIIQEKRYSFLKPQYRYLFKYSSLPRKAEQFWGEILAYRLGLKMDIAVPPAFVAYDGEKEQSGALSEWFVEKTPRASLLSEELYYEIYMRGGDLCQIFLPDFDRKKGKQHNFETICEIFTLLNDKYDFKGNWKAYWAKAFVFDALIGNTDRHQDNWGVIYLFKKGENKIQKSWSAPLFDNSTSMGYEILLEQLKDYEKEENLEKYITGKKACHHMKWRYADIEERHGVPHAEMLRKIIERFPETYPLMIACLNKINKQDFKAILDDLVRFDIVEKGQILC